MTSEFERKNDPSVTNTLSNVMSDKDYLRGSEPEGSGWDFGNWPGFDFREFRGWVLREKFFSIPTINNRVLSMRIIETDPKQFDVKTEEGKIEIPFTITPVTAKGIPNIFIGKNASGQERILRNKSEPLKWHQVPEEFRFLSNKFTNPKRSSTEQDNEGSEWANFLNDVLTNKRILPEHFQPTDFMVRDQLELSANVKYSMKDEKLAEMQIIEQELLMMAYADLTVTA